MKDLYEITQSVQSLAEFTERFTSWQSTLRRVSTRKHLREIVSNEPKRLKGEITGGYIADAYISAYVEWLCKNAKIKTPSWITPGSCSLEKPWFASKDEKKRSKLKEKAPQSFRERNIYDIPEDIINIRRGRPLKPEEEKRRVNAERQKRYRQRVMAKLKRLKELEKDLEG